MANIPHVESTVDRMFRNIINTMIDVINSNGETLFDSVSFEEWLERNEFRPLPAVSSFSDLPNEASKGDIRGVLNGDGIYIFDGNKWIPFSNSFYNELIEVEKELSSSEYYDEITYEKLYSDEMKSYYYKTIIPYKDKNGERIELKKGIANDELNTFERPQDFSFRVNASLVSNASVFSNGHLVGKQIKDGVLLQERPTLAYTLGVDNEGFLKAYAPEVSGEDIIADGIVNAWSGFYPLIEDYVPVDSTIFEPIANTKQKHPRQVITQNEFGDITIYSIAGRDGYSEGATYAEMVDFFMANNIKFAFNLDGGGSGVTIVRGSHVNYPTDNELKDTRPVADFIYIKKPTKNRETLKFNQYDSNMVFEKMAEIRSEVIKNRNFLENMGNLPDTINLRSNIDDITVSGFYWAGSATTGSPNSVANAVIHFNYNDLTAIQLAIPFVSNSSSILYRRKVNGLWENWVDRGLSNSRTLSLSGSWQPYAGSTSLKAVVINGVVHISGRLKGGSITSGESNPIFTLPSDLIPREHKLPMAVEIYSGEAHSVNMFVRSDNGKVYPLSNLKGNQSLSFNFSYTL